MKVTAFLKNSNLTWRLKSEKLYQFPRVRIKWCCIHFTSNIQEALLKLQTHTGEVWGRIILYFLFKCRFVSSVFFYLFTAHSEQTIIYNDRFVGYVKVARLRDRIWVECTNYVLHNHHGLCISYNTRWAACLQWMFKYSDTQNTKIRQLNHLRFYCPTSDFTVRPQNLQYDLRIYSTTSESTVRPQNLQYDLRIYSTTSEFTVRPQSFTVRPGFLEVQILVQPDPAEVYYTWFQEPWECHLAAVVSF